ncbi:hypothetical protein RISK_003211 [Rhodopirellula islandica]|uniref:Uncharacterized protein n=1 Tax=Rhodopirellula islandica TaxID=595434 RepID=A0A0J1BEE2_RHOIS|nr:hypothetical protein RISK_003211 [Rhodopirellula islandica]
MAFTALLMHRGGKLAFFDKGRRQLVSLASPIAIHCSVSVRGGLTVNPNHFDGG